MLADDDGERRLTDLRHLAQLLHRAASAEQLGVTALRGWLRAADRRGRREDTGDEERSRRLESDAEAVQVLTIHRSKGLEFPIVYCPFLWDPGYIPRDTEPGVLPRSRRRRRRTIDVGARRAPSSTRHERQHVARAARRGPAPRLRRADPRPAPGGDLVGGLVATAGTRRSAGCCSRATHDGNVAPEGRRHAERRGDARALRASSPSRRPGAISVERSTLGVPATWSPPRRAAGDLARRARSTAGSTCAGGGRPTATSPPSAHEAVRGERARGAGPRRRAGRGRSPVARVDGPAPGVDGSSPSPLGDDAGRGRVRDVRAPGARGDRLRRGRPRRPSSPRGSSGRRRAARVELGEPGGVVAGLRAAIETPLGPIVDDLRLRDVAPRGPARRARVRAAAGRRRRADRAAHADGDRRRRCVAHLPPERPDGRLRRAGSRTRRCARSVRGFLTGSIDLVVRLGRGRAALRGRRLQDQLARAGRRAADPARTTGRARWPPR